MLRTRISFAGKGSGRRTVKVTSARGRGVGVGPDGPVGVVGPAVGKKDGHSSSVMAQAWLARARIRINIRMRREKRGRDFIVSPRCLIRQGLLRINLVRSLPCVLFARRRRYSSIQC